LLTVFQAWLLDLLLLLKRVNDFDQNISDLLQWALEHSHERSKNNFMMMKIIDVRVYQRLYHGFDLSC